MAARKTPDAEDLLSSGVLWSFDLWHQALYPYAEKAENKK